MDGSFIRHIPCAQCGSTDANSLYTDGHQFCFSCQTYTAPSQDTEEGSFSVSKERGGGNRINPLLTDLEPLEKNYRGLTTETLSKFGCKRGVHNGQKVIVYPYTDSSGRIIAQKLRTLDKQFSTKGDFKGIQLFGQNLWRNSGDYRKRIVITEGENDCMSISQAFNNKWQVVSIPAGAQSAVKYLKEHLEYLEGYEEVVLAFDSDEPGRKAAEECCLLFSPGKAKVADFSPFKDANDWLQEGKSSEIVQRIYDAKQHRPDGIVAASDLWEAVIAPPQKGYDIQFPKLNEMLNGFRKGELVLWTAGSGLGKSTIVHEIGYYLKQTYGLRIGVVALEENVRRTIERYMSIHLDKPIHISREGIDEETLREAFDSVVDNLYLYDHWGSLETNNLLSKLRYMVKALGVDFIILDHISIIISGLDNAGADERKDIDKLMTNLRSLAEEAQVGILAIVHLKRKEQGKAFNEGRQVSLSDLRGSGSLEQLSDAVVAIERDQQGSKPNEPNLRVLKNRFKGVTGVADTLTYSPETGRLKVKSGEFENEETNEEVEF